MILFQLLALPVVTFLFVHSVAAIWRRSHPRGILFLRALVWLLAGIAILDPELTIRIARRLGIGRGADLVLYLMAICFFIAAFYFYGRIMRIESNISEIVRQLAIRDATQRSLEHPRESDAGDGKKGSDRGEQLGHKATGTDPAEPRG